MRGRRVPSDRGVRDVRSGLVEATTRSVADPFEERLVNSARAAMHCLVGSHRGDSITGKSRCTFDASRRGFLPQKPSTNKPAPLRVVQRLE